LGPVEGVLRGTLVDDEKRPKLGVHTQAQIK